MHNILSKIYSDEQSNIITPAVVVNYNTITLNSGEADVRYDDRERNCAESYNKWHNNIFLKLQSAFR